VIAHALICVFGFAILLSPGALVARYMRTFRPWWSTTHWIAQFGTATRNLLGLELDNRTAGDDYKVCDPVRDLYDAEAVIEMGDYHPCALCALGAAIHYIKPKNAHRPPQNCLHAVLGIVIMILGMYQIHTGYDDVDE
ncbi:hypothetical protein FB451DRAFT_1045491, partial [Mycena latifolia]